MDNMAAISLGRRSEDGAGSWRTRHLKIRSAYVRENVASGSLHLEYVPGTLQLADILTKALPAQRHKEISSLWGMAEGVADNLKARVLSLIMMCACCCTVEGSRADANLALDTSMEFYIVMGMAAVTLLVMWEGVCWLWVRIQAWSLATPVESRHARRLRRLQEAVGEEIHTQLAGLVTEPPRLPGREVMNVATPPRRRAVDASDFEVVTRLGEEAASSTAPPPPPLGTMQRSSSASTPRRSPPAALERGRAATSSHHSGGLISTSEAAVQADGLGFQFLPPEPAVARLEIREVFPEEYYMTQHGAHVHVHRNCWGLRNASSVVSRRLCECCRNNEGRSLYNR